MRLRGAGRHGALGVENVMWVIRLALMLSARNCYWRRVRWGRPQAPPIPQLGLQRLGYAMGVPLVLRFGNHFLSPQQSRS